MQLIYVKPPNYLQGGLGNSELTNKSQGTDMSSDDTGDSGLDSRL